MKQEEWLIAYIDAAFDGVTLEDGKDIYEAQSDDDYGNPDELALSDVAERENWRLVPHEDLHRRFWGVTFLDTKGLRFYMPAIMLAILEPNGLHSALMPWFLTRLRTGDAFPECDPPLSKLLTNTQKAAVVRFLKLLAFNIHGMDSDVMYTLEVFQKQK
jgi:hypothetical protein